MRFTNETPLVFLDTETTGMPNQRNRVIELAAIRVEGGKEVARIDTLLNPGIDVPEFITAITGIRNHEVIDAPRFEDIAEDLLALLDGAVLVAHNARFDHAFLKSEYQRLGMPVRVPTLCTVRLSRRLFPEQGRHRLDELAMAAGVRFDRRHRALDDTLALVRWWQFAHDTHGHELVTDTAAKLVANPALPAFLDDDVIGSLPNGPGVYLLYAEDDELLYVGKSVRIRERVRSHFSQDYSSSKEMTITARTRRIECEETAGELGALLRESQLIKERQPTYNQMLRASKTLIALERTEDASGFHRLALKRVARFDPKEMDRVVGFARTLGSAKDRLDKIAKEHMLCQHLTSSAKLSGSPCFAQTLGWCRGACVAGETPETYNARVHAACAAIGMKSWPHEGPVTFRERHPSGRFTDEFVVEHWTVLERRRICHDDESCEIEEYEPRLDLDAFKIVAKALR